MAVFPTLASGTTAFYPATEVRRFNTGIIEFINDSEQRWRKQAQLRRFIIQLDDLSRADRNTVRSFHNSVKGSFDATWTYPFNGTNYDYCVFEEDGFNERETKPNHFSVTLRIRQVRKN